MDASIIVTNKFYFMLIYYILYWINKCTMYFIRMTNNILYSFLKLENKKGSYYLRKGE